MLMTSERRPAIRTLRGWAIHVLQEADAIRECEEHGWMQDRADPHARAFDVARPFVAKYEGGERRIDVLEFVTICPAIGADSSKLLKSLKKSIGLP